MVTVLKITEREFQAQVVALAKLYDFFVFHPYHMQRSTSGWPDLALCRPPRLILAELKTEKGKLTHMQKLWGERLDKCAGIEYYLWRPSSWEEIRRVFRYERTLAMSEK